MSTFELALESLHREVVRTDKEESAVNFRHNGRDWIVWLGDGPPETSRQWYGLKGENALRAACFDAVSALDPLWWKR